MLISAPRKKNCLHYWMQLFPKRIYFNSQKILWLFISISVQYSDLLTGKGYLNKNHSDASVITGTMFLKAMEQLLNTEIGHHMPTLSSCFNNKVSIPFCYVMPLTHIRDNIHTKGRLYVSLVESHTASREKIINVHCMKTRGVATHILHVQETA